MGGMGGDTSMGGAGGDTSMGGAGGGSGDEDLVALCEFIFSEGERCGLNDDEEGQTSVSDCVGELTAQGVDGASVLACLEPNFENGACPETDTDSEVLGECFLAGNPVFQLASGFTEPLCEKQEECCEGAEEGTYDELCDFFGGFMAVFLMSDVEAGFVRIDVEAAEACVETVRTAFESASCDDFISGEFSQPNGFESCEGAIVPLRGEGETCGTVEEDEDGLASGYSVSHAACTDGLYCGFGDEDGAAPICMLTVGLGEACGEQEACGDDAFCQELICSNEPLADGKSCHDDEMCASGICNTDETTGEQTCGPTRTNDICRVPEFE